MTLLGLIRGVTKQELVKKLRRRGVTAVDIDIKDTHRKRSYIEYLIGVIRVELSDSGGSLYNVKIKELKRLNARPSLFCDRLRETSQVRWELDNAKDKAYEIVGLLKHEGIDVIVEDYHIPPYERGK